MSTKMGRLHVVIPDDLHAQAKAAAAIARLTLKDYVIAAIAEKVERNEAGRGGAERTRKRS